MSRKNILFIMCDQLRFDYLGCAGHPTIKTPNIDKLAAKGVRFTNAFCQSPICGPSRMSFYTGRYVSSHGSQSNFAPLRVGELNIGHHLNPLGMRTILVGHPSAMMMMPASASAPSSKVVTGRPSRIWW